MYKVACIFGITSSGSLTVLHSFTKSDGRGPYAGLIQASNGNFYGVTKEGGANCSSSDGCGTAFKVSVSYSTLTVACNGDGVVTGTDGFINCPGACHERRSTKSRQRPSTSGRSGCLGYVEMGDEKIGIRRLEHYDLHGWIRLEVGH